MIAVKMLMHVVLIVCQMQHFIKLRAFSLVAPMDA
jgi:hypothetical protein